VDVPVAVALPKKRKGGGKACFNDCVCWCLRRGLRLANNVIFCALVPVFFCTKNGNSSKLQKMKNELKKHSKINPDKYPKKTLVPFCDTT